MKGTVESPPNASQSPEKSSSAKPGENAEDDDFEKLLNSNNIDAIISTDLSGKDKIMHADDALDFESEDELADEEEEEEAKNGTAVEGGKDDWTESFAKDLGLFEDDFGPNEDQDQGEEDPMAQVRAEEARKKFEQEEREMAIAQLKEWYPGFEPHVVLKMNKLFGPNASLSQLPPQPRMVRPLYLNRVRLEVQPEQSTEFLNYEGELKPTKTVCRTKEITADSIRKVEIEVGKRLARLPDGFDPDDIQEEIVNKESGLKLKLQEGWQLDVSNWEDVLNADSDNELSVEPPREVVRKTGGVPRIGSMHFDDNDIYDSEYEDAILEGGVPAKRPKLDLNDSYLLFVEDKRMLQSGRSMMGDLHSNFESQLNISNDRAYDMLRANYQRKVRSTIGSLNIDHSMVALRLQSPFYKVQLSKPQLRSWHRNRFNIKPGTTIQFSALKPRKKKKDKNKIAQEVFARSSDLTLGDNAPVFLIEYSEETPLVLSGFGMGSKLINYYRKKSEDDKTRPKLPLGETHVLDVQDRSAFWNFGFIEPGNVVPTLYNQMVRAPVFQHQPKSTDFLIVKSTTRARGSKYFIREIPYQFVSGQAFPAVPIPGPHSRKKTTASKNRLKMIAYRALNKAPNHRLQVRDISAYFPEFNEVQNRQRLKDFMVYQRSGDDQGFWKVKPGEPLPTEEEIRNMVTPEDVMLLESMLVGEQHLKDSGYAKRLDQEVNDSDEGASIEEQLAPWNISRNFINAIQGKAMLQLNGQGDPTARGEGFSFLRTSMKGGFAAEVSLEDEKKLNGHSYNVALQQKAYDEEIRRIWYAQQRSLSVSDPRRLPEANKLPEIQSVPQTPSSSSSDKVLQITRVVRDQNDVLVRETELVTDPQVIRAYMRHRKTAEEEKMAVDRIAVSDNAELNKNSQKFLEQELARLNRNADRRKARKATKQDVKLKSTTRKCATCGMVGHIKTNKQCPMYNDIFLSASNGNGNGNGGSPRVGSQSQTKASNSARSTPQPPSDPVL